MEEVKLFQAVFQKGSQPNSKQIKLYSVNGIPPVIRSSLHFAPAHLHHLSSLELNCPSHRNFPPKNLQHLLDETCCQAEHHCIGSRAKVKLLLACVDRGTT